MVEVPRQDANFILPLDFNALGKIARRNLPRTERERADGRNQNLGKKEGENHADHKAEAKRAQDDRKELSCERVNCGAAV